MTLFLTLVGIAVVVLLVWGIKSAFRGRNQAQAAPATPAVVAQAGTTLIRAQRPAISTPWWFWKGFLTVIVVVGLAIFYWTAPADSFDWFRGLLLDKKGDVSIGSIILAAILVVGVGSFVKGWLKNESSKGVIAASNVFGFIAVTVTLILGLIVVGTYLIYGEEQAPTELENLRITVQEMIKPTEKPAPAATEAKPAPAVSAPAKERAPAAASNAPSASSGTMRHRGSTSARRSNANGEWPITWSGIEKGDVIPADMWSEGFYPSSGCRVTYPPGRGFVYRAQYIPPGGGTWKDYNHKPGSFPLSVAHRIAVLKSGKRGHTLYFTTSNCD